MEKLCGYGSLVGLLVGLCVIVNVYAQWWQPLEAVKAHQRKVFIVNATVVGPIVEELAFRAPLLIFFGGLSSNAWLANAFQAVLFGLLHAGKALRLGGGAKRLGPITAILSTVVLSSWGLLFGAVCLWSQGLVLPILMHAAQNIIATFAQLHWTELESELDR